MLQNGKHSPGGQFISKIEEVHGLLSGILRIMHPQQYHASMKAMQRILTSPKHTEIIDRWGCPFNALSIIVNRRCRPHRDTKSRISYFDLLGSFGNFTDFQFHMKSIGVTVNVQSGGMIGLCGHLILHEASECVGDRVCYAWYMRGSVHSAMEVAPASWMNQQVYRDFVPDPYPIFHRRWVEHML